MIKYSPSLMCANFLNLEEDIRAIDSAGVDFYHIDIMDGHFVPNLSLNFDIVRQVKRITNTPMDVHLMVDNPERYIDTLEKIKAEYVCFHVESTQFPIRLIKEIKNRGMKAGVALNPVTDPQVVNYLAEELDYVLVMSVEPGFSGQKFIQGVLPKIQYLYRLKNNFNKSLLIEVDGNIDVFNAKQCIEMGADILVLGTSGVFKPSQDLYYSIVEFKGILEESLKGECKSAG